MMVREHTWISFVGMSQEVRDNVLLCMALWALAKGAEREIYELGDSMIIIIVYCSV